MRRQAALALSLVLLLTAAVPLAGPAAGHAINHLSADAQLSPDGTVVMESAYATEDGFVVLYRNWTGSSGEVVGVTPFSASRQDVNEVPVAVNDSAWSRVSSNVTLTAVLHGDRDDDGEFDPETDAALSSFGQPTQAAFTVRRADRAAYVSAAGVGAQRSNGTVTVREVALTEGGHLVLRTSEGGEPGRVLGSVPLEAGVHRNVTVELNGSRPDAEKFAIFAVAYDDSGEMAGEFDDGDAPVRAGDSTVATRFTVSFAEGPVTPTENLVNTPTASGTPPSATTSGDDGTTDPPTSATDGQGPGFGVGSTLGVLAALAVLAARTRAGR